MFKKLAEILELFRKFNIVENKALGHKPKDGFVEYHLQPDGNDGFLLVNEELSCGSFNGPETHGIIFYLVHANGTVMVFRDQLHFLEHGEDKAKQLRQPNETWEQALTRHQAQPATELDLINIKAILEIMLQNITV